MNVILIVLSLLFDLLELLEDFILPQKSRDLYPNYFNRENPLNKINAYFKFIFNFCILDLSNIFKRFCKLTSLKSEK